jgi:hypothetical protein
MNVRCWDSDTSSNIGSKAQRRPVKPDKCCFSTTTSSGREISIEGVDSPAPERADSFRQHERMCVGGFSQDDGSCLSY